MIVNTAYIYMGSGGAVVYPNLWQDGVANYPVEFTNSSISSDGLILPSNGSAATFSELPLSDFNSLTLTGNASPAFRTTKIVIEFFNSAGQSLGKETMSFSTSYKTLTVNIPSSAKLKDAKIKITNTATGKIFTMSTALLS